MRAEVAAAFQRRCGRAAEGLWAAPGRVNLIGEHTDYNDGWVLPFALDSEVVVAAAKRSDARLRMWSLQEEGDVVEVALEGLEPGGVKGWGAFVAGVAWALGGDVPGADLVFGSTVPLGAGLSSSAALTCATAAALCDLEGRELSPVDLAMTARSAEADFVGAPVGVMDQLASVLGQAGHALLIDTRTLDVEPLPFDTGARDLALLILDTKVQHSVGSGEYAERRSSCEKAAQALDLPALRDANLQDLERLEDELLKRRARHVVTENDRVLATAGRLREGDLTGIGPLMSASHESLRDDFEVSAPELDAVVAAALRAGALGARMTGAGFGGSAIALVAADREDPVREAVLEALPACEIVPAEPSDGARRLA